MAWAFETSESIPRATPPPTKPHLIIHSKQFRQLWPKHPNRWVYGIHSHQNHHTIFLSFSCHMSTSSIINYKTIWCISSFILKTVRSILWVLHNSKTYRYLVKEKNTENQGKNVHIEQNAMVTLYSIIKNIEIQLFVGFAIFKDNAEIWASLKEMCESPRVWRSVKF